MMYKHEITYQKQMKNGINQKLVLDFLFCSFSL